MSHTYTFTHAVVREPGASVIDGLRAHDIGAPDLERFKRDLGDYVAAVRAAGATVRQLEALEDFPDSVFVEDTALCLPEVAIILRPGAPSRRGETNSIKSVLAEFYSDVLTIADHGFIEGGDILVIDKEILIGRSQRTNQAGIAALRAIVSQWGYRVREVAMPAGVLHFKSDCSVLDEETVLSTERLAANGCFSGYRVIPTVAGEEAAANAVRFNSVVLFAKGFPRTAERLAKYNYNVCEIGNAEAAKLDGGMSCLSLRFSVLE